MENSGVHAVFAVRKTFIEEVLNRMAVCELNPLQINGLELANSTTRGEVLVRWLEVEIAVRADMHQDNLRVFAEIRKAPDWIRSLLEEFLEESPFEFNLTDRLQGMVRIARCGLKVGGNGELLVAGAEIAGSATCSWNLFYGAYSGADVIGDGNAWGVWVGRSTGDGLIRKLADQALSGQEALQLTEFELWSIEWPGGVIRLKGVGEYMMDCWWGDQDFDFRWTAELTFPIDGSRISARLRITDAKPRGERDSWNAFWCDFNIADLFSLLIFNIAFLVARIIMKVVEASGADKPEIVKEVVDLSFRQTGTLRPTLAEPTTEGLHLAGQGARETVDSRLALYGSPGEPGIPMEKTIYTAFPCFGRPTESLTAVLHIQNTGTASHTICGAELQQDPFLGGFAVSDALMGALPLIVLPGETLRIGVSFHPPVLAQYGETYRATLNLNTLKKSFSGKDITHTHDQRTVEISATYHCVQVANGFHFPEYGLGAELGSIQAEVGFDKPMFDWTHRMPWEDIPIPDEGIEILDIGTRDPAVSSVEILDDHGAVVAEMASGRIGQYISIAMEKGSSYGIKAGARMPRSTPTKKKSQGKERSVPSAIFECRKAILSPASRISFTAPVTHAILRGSRLYVSAGAELCVYDVRDPVHPTRLCTETMKKPVIAFDVAKSLRTKEGGYLLGCVEGTSLARLEFTAKPGEAAGFRSVVRQPIHLDIKGTARARFIGSNYLVMGPQGIAILDARDPSGFKLISDVRLKSAVNDAVMRCHFVFAGTDKGVETVNILNPEAPQMVGMFETDNPVGSLGTTGPLLMAHTGKDRIVILESGTPASLKVVGRYTKLSWTGWLTLEGDVGFSIGSERKQVILYQRQVVMADIKQLKRFSKK